MRSRGPPAACSRWSSVRYCRGLTRLRPRDQPRPEAKKRLPGQGLHGPPVTDPAFRAKLLEPSARRSPIRRPAVFTTVFSKSCTAARTYLARARALGRALMGRSQRRVRTPVCKGGGRPSIAEDRLALSGAPSWTTSCSTRDATRTITRSPEFFVKGCDGLSRRSSARGSRGWGGRGVAIPFEHHVRPQSCSRIRRSMKLRQLKIDSTEADRL